MLSPICSDADKLLKLQGEDAMLPLLDVVCRYKG